MKSKVVDYDGICAICGKPKECYHHLIFGNGLRKLADEDGLIIPLCNGCHNMQYTPFRTAQIHENSAAEALSKMFGQAIWERNWIAENFMDVIDSGNIEILKELQALSVDDLYRIARLQFTARYGRSWI